MTTSLQGSAGSIETIAPFSSLSPQGLRRLRDNQSTLVFKEGQVLSPGDRVDDRILVLLAGEARLLGSRDGRPFMVERLGAGAIVGLASLLRAEGCEAVSAASTVSQMRRYRDFMAATGQGEQRRRGPEGSGRQPA